MVYTENGTYTAVWRRTPHHCTRSPPEAMPLPNQGVLSAAPCTINYLQKQLQDLILHKYTYKINFKLISRIINDVK